MDERNHREKKLEEKHFSMGQNVKKNRYRMPYRFFERSPVYSEMPRAYLEYIRIGQKNKSKNLTIQKMNVSIFALYIFISTYESKTVIISERRRVRGASFYR